MARTKTRPRMCQYSPESGQRANTGQERVEKVDEKFLPAADEELCEEQMSYMKQLFLSKFSSNHDRPGPLPVTRRPTPAIVETINEAIEKKAKPAANVSEIKTVPTLTQEPLTVGRANNDITTCPDCHSEFRTGALLEFRQHVEACTRRTTTDSGSDVSTLSPPPESPKGRPQKDSLRTDEDSEEEFPFPYEDNEFDILPESRVSGIKAAEPKEPEFEELGPNPLDPVENDALQDDLADEARQDDVLQGDATDVEEVQLTFKFPKITDTSKFAKSLEDMEDLPYHKLYARVANAQRALVAWQNEFIDLQRVASRYDEREPSKPRVPKPHLIGLGYEDQLESFIYGYEHNTHKSKLGDQKPLLQRATRWQTVGRELRQRVLAQRTNDLDLTEGPDSDIEHDIFGRNNLNDQDNGGSRRGSRIRNQPSRYNSEISQTPPRKPVSLGKTVGRPKGDKSRNSNGPRMVELQLEESNNEDVSQSIDQDTDDADSASNSAGTGESDDQEGQQSNRIRKRQHTSDFEDDLPANKRIRQQGSVVENIKGKGRGSDAHTRNDEDATNVKSAEPSSRSLKMKNTQLNAWARDDGTRRKKQSEDTKKRWEEKKALGYTTLSGPSSSPSIKPKIKKQTAKDRTADQTENGEGKQSAASRNMLRRWAEKRRALELGLPVPKIGRYAKGQTPASTSDADRKSDHTQASSKDATKRKRKRAVEESGDGDTIENDAPPRKRHVSNQRKPRLGSTKARTVSTANSPAFGSEDKKTAGNTGSQEAPATAPKQKGSRWKKNDREDNIKTNSGGKNAIAAGIGITKPNSREKKATAKVNKEPTSTQQMQTRASGRIRRQTSAARIIPSSQNDARRSSQSSSKRTATPTPSLSQSTAIMNGEPDPSTENITIKQEHLASPAMPKKKRGRGPNYEWVPIDPVAEAAAAESEQVALEEASGKTRRSRQPKTSGLKTTIIDIESTTPTAKAKRRRTPKIIAGIEPDNDAIGATQTPTRGKESKATGAEIISNSPPLEKSQTKGVSSGPKSKKTSLVDAGKSSIAHQPVEAENFKDCDVETAKARAKKSKSEKMSAVMKGRWASGQMREIMAKKKANNIARKDAAVLGGSPSSEGPEGALIECLFERLQAEAITEPEPEPETEPEPEPELEPEPESVPAPASTRLPARRSSRAPKRRRIAIYDGADDSPDESRGFISSPLGGRSRRPAALRASQSFSKIISAVNHEGNDNEEEPDGQNKNVIVMDKNYSPGPDSINDEELIDREIKRQFESEFDQTVSSDIVPGIVLGKRKRKPVINLEEAMRIELGREDDEF